MSLNKRVRDFDQGEDHRDGMRRRIILREENVPSRAMSRFIKRVVRLSPDYSEVVDSTDDTMVVSPSASQEQQIQSSIQLTKEDIANIKRRITDLNKLQLAREHELMALESQLGHVTWNEKGKGKRRELSEADYQNKKFQWDDKLLMEMEQVFNIRDFRLCQRGVCNAVMDRRDVFCVMPTGGGKSLTYQLPALLQEGCTIVVSPLLALMSDQIHHLRQLKIEAVKVTGGISEAYRNNIYRRLRGMANRALLRHDDKEIKLLYVTPELICRNQGFNGLLDELAAHNKIARIVIDEAHCVTEMGHDFREDYSKLHILRTQYPNVPILALSATCPPSILNHVIKDLGLRNIQPPNPHRTLYFASPLYRRNLHYAVLLKPEEKPRTILLMAQFIMDHHPDGSGIIYCLRKKETEGVARELMKVSDGKIKAGFYHSGRSVADKEMLHRQWQNGDIKVVCATIAFGLGINKGDVRFVLHYSVSRSIECYYQESGRAGRDGKNADCILFYRPQDAMSIFSMNETRKGGQENVLSIIEFCEDLETCRKIQFARYFSISSSVDQQHSLANEEDDWMECGHCDNCNRSEKEKEKKDFTQEAWSMVQFVKSAGKQAPSMNQLVEGVKDDVRLRIQEKKHLIAHLLTKKILQVRLVRSSRGHVRSEAHVYVTTGPNANQFFGPLDNLPRNVIKYAFISRPKIPSSPKKTKQTSAEPEQGSDQRSEENEESKVCDDLDEKEDTPITPPPRKKRKCTESPDDADDEAREGTQWVEESEEETDGCIVSYMTGKSPWSYSMCQLPLPRRRKEEEIYLVPDSEED